MSFTKVDSKNDALECGYGGYLYKLSFSIMHISSQNIQIMEQRYRATFINSLPGYKCLQMVGTINDAGQTNLGIFNSIFHLGAHPPLLGMIFRPESEDHNTLKNIKDTGIYTFNNILPEWFEQAHQTSARYATGVSEFEECGFKEMILPHFRAPFVAQSTIKIGLELRETVDIKINATTLVIGEITQIILDNEDLVAADGYVDHIKAKTVTVTGLDAYFNTNALGRLAYAKPNISPKQI